MAPVNTGRAIKCPAQQWCLKQLMDKTWTHKKKKKLMGYLFPESFTFKLIVICQTDEVSALEASFVNTALYFSKYS